MHKHALARIVVDSRPNPLRVKVWKVVHLAMCPQYSLQIFDFNLD